MEAVATFDKFSAVKKNGVMAELMTSTIAKNTTAMDTFALSTEMTMAFTTDSSSRRLLDDGLLPVAVAKNASDPGGLLLRPRSRR